jgi:hypothetical protein
VPAVLGFMVIISLVISKYLQFPYIFLVIVVLAAIVYQKQTNRENMRTDNFEETLINVSKFIIVTGISGYVVARIVGLFLPEFN